MSLVDSIDQAVGTLIDPYQGTVVRKVGDDLVSFQPPRNGFVNYAINFFHTSPDCSGPRYMQNYNGAGYAYAAQVRGTTLFFTRTVDPARTSTVAVGSYETLAAGQDPGAVGSCTPYTATLAAGPAVAVIDATLGTLVPPFHIK